MKNILTVSAILELATGLGLVLAPALVVQLLLGTELVGVGIVIARVAGIALIALGYACLPGRTPLGGMLIYSLLVTLYLASLGIAGEFTGRLLWPTVGLHVVLIFLLAGSTRVSKSPQISP